MGHEQPVPGRERPAPTTGTGLLMKLSSTEPGKDAGPHRGRRSRACRDRFNARWGGQALARSGFRADARSLACHNAAVPCVLTVAGREFDPEAWLERIQLRAYRVVYTGDQFAGKRGRSTRSFFSADVSRRDFCDFGRQLSDAKRFLRTHSPGLRELTRDPAVETAVLDFGVEARLARGSIVVQCVVFPADLVSLAGNCGLALEALYPTEVRRGKRTVKGSLR